MDENTTTHNNASNSNLTIILTTVETPVSGHPREAEKVSATGAGHLGNV